MRINLGASTRLESKTVAQLVEEKRKAKLEAQRRKELEQKLFRDDWTPDMLKDKKDLNLTSEPENGSYCARVRRPGSRINSSKRRII